MIRLVQIALLLPLTISRLHPAPLPIPAMQGRPGAALLIDASTGSILALHDPASAERARTPGSTVKPFVALTLEPSNPSLVCETKLAIAGRRLDCSHPKLAHPLDSRTALAYSCNFFFARSSSTLDPSRLAAALERWGFQTEPSNSSSLLALGEQGIRISPRALAEAYRKLAQLKDHVILTALTGAVEYGSAQLASSPGLSIAGKTGTTLAPSGTYTHAWFAGWTPARTPEVIAVVFLEQGRGGSNAAPIAAQIFRDWAARSRTATPNR